MPFTLGVSCVIYYKATPYFLHILCSFLSVLPGIVKSYIFNKSTREVILSKNQPSSLESVTFLVEKL